jgi:F-type H+-transporting ATPase subunit b
MLINWFTVLAQIVNFLVLVALLKHFLWDRLVKAIDQREAKVSGELAKAEEKCKAAEQQMEQVRALALEQQCRCNEIMAQARKDADEQRNRLVQQARESVRQLEAEWQEDLERERETFFKELRRRAATEILVVTRQALADLASAELQHSAVQVFIDKLQSLDRATVCQLAKGDLTVRSAAELPEETKENIGKTLAEELRVTSHPEFVREPGMAWGIELRGNGLKIGWSPDNYLDSLVEELKSELDRRSAASYRAMAR